MQTENTEIQETKEMSSMFSPTSTEIKQVRVTDLRELQIRIDAIAEYLDDGFLSAHDLEPISKKIDSILLS